MRVYVCKREISLSIGTLNINLLHIIERVVLYCILVNKNY